MSTIRDHSRFVFHLGLACAFAMSASSCGRSRGAAVRGDHATGASVSWQAPATLSQATDGGAAPLFATSPTGRLALAWVAAPDRGSDGRLFVATWKDLAATATAPARASELRDSLGSLSIEGEVPPKIAYAANGALYAAYLVTKIVPGERWPRNALRFAVSPDGGQHWNAPTTVTHDTLFGSYSDHALYVARDGAVYLSWLAQVTPDTSRTYVARSTDGGHTWSRPVVVDADPACPCCRTAMAGGPDGTLYLSWRKRFPGEFRDIVVARSTDRGMTWSTPVRVHVDAWHVTYCPDAGPSIKVGTDGTIHIAWWTGKQGAAGTQYAQSTDGGRSFSPAVPLGLATYSRAAHVQLGLGTGTDSNFVVAAWDDGTLQTPAIAVRVSSDGGRSFGPRQIISAPGQDAGYPVVTVHGDTVLLAWQQRSDREAALASAQLAAKDPQAASTYINSVGALQIIGRRGTLAGGA